MWVRKSKKKMCKKGYIWNPATGSCENGRYAKSIIDDSVVTSDEVIKSKLVTFNFVVHSPFLSITHFHDLRSFTNSFWKVNI